MTVTRRDFLAAGLTSLAGGLIVPPILAKGVFAAGADGTQNNRVLVIVQLAGGNDGLNTVVPYADPAYASARPTIGVHPESILHLDGQTGLNGALSGLKSLYDAGQLAIVRGVGYDNPTYSHFENLYVWEYADPARRRTEGWLGALLAHQTRSAQPLTACALGEASTPAELRAQGATVTSMQTLSSYVVRGSATQQRLAPTLYRSTPGAYGVLFDNALTTAEQGIAQLRSSASYSPRATYAPAVAAAAGGSPTAAGRSRDQLGAALQLTARLIVTQPAVKLCHVVISGFDTHQNEVAVQTALLTELDAAIAGFMKDIAAHGQAGRVVLMTWSEFGRRVKENASSGTDHGAAAPLFIVGAPVRGGLYGEQPSLTSTIDGGNLKHTVDFRSVYQSLIGDWLQGDPASVLGGSFPRLGLIRTA